MFVLSGAVIATLAAVLFGVSPVLIKIVSGKIPPILMAGILYIGSAAGLAVLRLSRREKFFAPLKQLPLRQKKQLCGAILCGGILAPICLAYGISQAPAFLVSALFNLETVATTLIAWWIFKEHVGGRVWFGQALILVGSIVISFAGSVSMSVLFPSLCIAAASILWAIDNNLTRDIEELPGALLAEVKGHVAGIFNTGLGLFLGQRIADANAIAGTFVIGIFCYGISLLCIVVALRKIGTSRTGTFFSMAPFVGMLASVVFLAERPPMSQWIAGVLMFLGICALYQEHHEHEHTHEEMEHTHMHVTDAHHQHEHDGNEGPEPHSHKHKHTRLTHTHPHHPDIHHRHGHG